ncbi:MAG: SUMF1/EgtB/PvdO family nonheme iron enzyme [Halioglobus sp.]
MNLKQTFFKLLLLAVLLPASILTAQAQFQFKDIFRDSLRSGGKGPEMIVIPDGNFVLGGGRPGADGMGLVKFDYKLAVSTTEVTIGQYRAYLAGSLSGRPIPKGNENLPASGISFDEAEAYVDWLSRQTGHYYRLPSSAEWEYAARAGTSTAYSWGNEVGENTASCLNCKSDYTGAIAPVGSFPANPWGLYDMHGNVWEWTKDCIDPNMAPPPNGMPILFGNCDLRELRGGSAKADAWSIRASTRATAQRVAKSPDLGFRVVMDEPK